MTRLIRYLFPSWPVYRVAPRLANPSYLSMYLGCLGCGGRNQWERR